MNKINLICLPASVNIAYVTESFEAEEPIAEQQIFYESLEQDVNNLIEQYNVDEIMLVGPMSYIEHIGQILGKNEKVTIYVVDINNTSGGF